ncbi:hypothetical protein N7540_010050 [Penicillium herquei]|nr:hypothetical protein N7540_010050 [Penicillium herquei]
MTEDQKNAVIQRLQHCCVESTWDGLFARLSPLQKEKIASVIMECFVWNAVVSIYEENPFWFLDGKSSSEDDEGEESFSRRLNYLYQRFYLSNPIVAATWRSETWRLLTPRNRYQASDYTIGLEHKRRRE